MKLSPDSEVVVIAVALIIAFAVGRHSVTLLSAVETVETTHEDTKKQEEVATHTQVKTVVVKQPSGQETTTTTTDIVADDKSDEAQVSDTKIEQTVTPQKRPTLNVSLLAAQNVYALGVPLYGISVQKEVLGPVTIGAWGLNNGTVGLSIGLNF